MQSHVSRYLRLSRAAGSVALLLTRVAENRVWPDDDATLKTIVCALRQLAEKGTTLVSTRESFSGSALITPQGLGLFSCSNDLQLSELVDRLDSVATSAFKEPVPSEVRDLAESLAKRFHELDRLAEERAALAERGGEDKIAYPDPLGVA